MSISRCLRRWGRATIATAAVLGLGLTAALAASAETGPIVHDQLVAFFDQNGVDQSTQIALFDKLDDGVPWDSLTDAQPVETEARVVNGKDVVVQIYADGSIATTSVEAPTPRAEGSVTPRGIDGCTATTSGTTRIRTNCSVTRPSGVISSKIKANYRWTYSNASSVVVGSARIDSVSSPSMTVIGGTYSGLTVVVQRTNAAPGASASARLSADVATVGGWAGGTSVTRLIVPMGDTTLAYVSGSD